MNKDLKGKLKSLSPEQLSELKLALQDDDKKDDDPDVYEMINALTTKVEALENMLSEKPGVGDPAETKKKSGWLDNLFSE